MADVIHGPVRTLPGALHPVPAGAMCDDHPDRPATARIQGETDSMGCELHDACDECRVRLLPVARDRYYPGQCELCGTFKDSLAKWRDPEEGTSGRVYDACKECRDDRTRPLADEDAPAPADDEVNRSEVAQMVDEFDQPDFEDSLLPDLDSDTQDR